MTKKDSIYAKPLDSIADFSFDDTVVRVFPDMIQRSVPGYSTIIAMTGVIAERYAQNDSHCYDLGCSLGASTLSMRQQLDAKSCKIIAVDNSEAMIARCKTLIELDQHQTLVELIQDDVLNIAINNSSVAVLNFTLQFISPSQRLDLLTTIFNGMCEGGVLVLSEKIHFDDPHLQSLNTDLHHSFKRANGYSDMEISQKRTSLENVLVTDSIPLHQRRLKDIGFNSVDVWFQCFNFMSLVAIK
jgi:tRNA (cmo5U34)-methyltransferase